MDRALAQRPVTRTSFFSQAIQNCGNKDFITKIRIWLSKAGPFWQDEQRQDQDRAFFSYAGKPLDKSILSEAGWRQLKGQDSPLLSLAPSEFETTPLALLFEDLEDQDLLLDLLNFWEAAPLSIFIKDQEKEPDNWKEWFEAISNRFEHLSFGKEFLNHLETESWSRVNASRAIELLNYLNDYVICCKDPSLKSKQSEMEKMYFSGDGAIFSPGSKTDKKYDRKLSFEVPGHQDKVVCQWHGKLRHNAWRMHFHSLKSDPICIVYLGRKLAL